MSRMVLMAMALVGALSAPAAGLAAEKTVEFMVDGHKVVGTLALPDGIASPPAVLLLHGFTGSRDELEIPAAKEGIFRRAARIWAVQGIASLRIDFRGNGDSGGAFADMTLDGQVKDALAALDFLAGGGEVDKDRIALVGWSMGGAVGAIAAGRAKQKLTSVSLWAPGTNMPASIALLFGADLVKQGLASGDRPVTAKLPWGAEVSLKSGFFRSLYATDPVAEIARYKGPLLVAVGSKDDVVFPQPIAGQVLLDNHDGPEELWVRPMDHVFNAFDGVDMVDELIAKTGSFIAAATPPAALAADYETKGVTENNLPVFYQKLKDQLHFALAWDPASGDFPQWRATARAKLWDLLIQPDDSAPFDARVVEEQDRGDYVARKIVLSITGNSRIAALLLVPKGQGPFPAALVLHDHGGKFDIGKEKMVRPWADAARLASARAWVDRYYSGNFIGDDLARRGYVVLATDALGWGDRQNNGPESQQALASNLFNLGSSLAGTIAVEDVRAARYLASLPEVDKGRVAAIGFSMGAFRAWQAAALTDTVTAGVAVNWMATLDGLMVPGNNQLKGQSAFNMLHPGMFRWFDYPDAAAIAAPKPMLFYAGETDPLFPVASVRLAFARMERVWADAGAPDRFAAKVWPNAHIFRAEEQSEAFDWLDRQFGRAE